MYAHVHTDTSKHTQSYPHITHITHVCQHDNFYMNLVFEYVYTHSYQLYPIIPNIHGFSVNVPPTMTKTAGCRIRSLLFQSPSEVQS